MRPAGEPLQCTLPDKILDHEGEARNLHQRCSRKVWRKQIDGLAGPRRSRGAADQCPQALSVRPAVRIEHNYDFGRIGAQVLARCGKREPLAPMSRIIAHQHICRGRPGAIGSPVGTIVRDN